MTDTTSKAFTVRFARLPRRGLLLGLSAPRVVCVALAMLVLVPAMFLASTTGALVTATGRPRAGWRRRRRGPTARCAA